MISCAMAKKTVRGVALDLQNEESILRDDVSRTTESCLFQRNYKVYDVESTESRSFP